MKKPMFIAFEGLDASGKSTVSKMVAEQLNARLVRSPDINLEAVRKEIDAFYEGNGLALQLFYASTVAHASGEIKSILSQGQSVVIDRYWASTIVYDSIVRDSGVSDAIWIGEIFGSLVFPDFTVYINAPKHIRESRMKARNKNERGEFNKTDKDSIDLGEDLANRYKTVLSQYEGKQSGKFICVDNTQTLEDCVQQIMKKIGA